MQSDRTIQTPSPLWPRATKTYSPLALRACQCWADRLTTPDLTVMTARQRILVLQNSLAMRTAGPLFVERILLIMSLDYTVVWAGCHIPTFSKRCFMLQLHLISFDRSNLHLIRTLSSGSGGQQRMQQIRRATQPESIASEAKTTQMGFGGPIHFHVMSSECRITTSSDRALPFPRLALPHGEH